MTEKRPPSESEVGANLIPSFPPGRGGKGGRGGKQVAVSGEQSAGSSQRGAVSGEQSAGSSQPSQPSQRAE